MLKQQNLAFHYPEDLESFMCLYDMLETTLDENHRFSIVFAVNRLFEQIDLQLKGKMLHELKAKKTWTDAKEAAQLMLEKMKSTINSARLVYQSSVTLYREAKAAHANHIRLFEGTEVLIQSWRMVTNQTGMVMEQVIAKLQYVHENTSLLGQKTPSEALQYLKRHWPEFAISGGAGAGVGSIVAVTLLAATPVGYLLLGSGLLVCAGLGVGALVSYLRDRITPPGPSQGQLAAEGLQRLGDVQAVERVDLPGAPPVVDQEDRPGILSGIGDFIGGIFARGQSSTDATQLLPPAQTKN
jgi:hypothetical protein